MKATKLVIGASLLIALATAVPAAAAEGIPECTSDGSLDNLPGDDERSIDDCVAEKTFECQGLYLHPDGRILEFVPCLIGV